MRVDTLGDQVVVGDLMKSVNFLRIDRETSTLTEVGRDYNAHWMTQVRFLTPDRAIGADNLGNVLVLAKTRDPNVAAGDDAREDGGGRCIVEVEAAIHVGEVINAVAPGGLSRVQDDVPCLVTNQHLLGGACGSIFLMGQLERHHYEVLRALQNNILAMTGGGCDASHGEWRQLARERRRRGKAVPAFIDGDVIGRFVEMAAEEQEAVVVGRFGGPLTRSTAAQRSANASSGLAPVQDVGLAPNAVLAIVESVLSAHT